jgi:hypothetical protein
MHKHVDIYFQVLMCRFFLLLHPQFIQIVERRKLEVKYIYFEIKCRYKVDSNSINYIGD